MLDYIFFTHRDAGQTADEDWAGYIAGLQKAGVFQGGSAIGPGVCVRQEGSAPSTTDHLAGFIRVQAADLEHARRLLIGHPGYEAGGTVEIRELPRTD